MAVLPADESAGRLIITWPKAADGGSPMHGTTIGVTNADTGQQLVSALDLTVAVDLQQVVTAEMTMLTDERGRLLEGDRLAQVPVDASGEVYTGRFRWLVTEMRIAE